MRPLICHYTARTRKGQEAFTKISVEMAPERELARKGRTTAGLLMGIIQEGMDKGLPHWATAKGAEIDATAIDQSTIQILLIEGLDTPA